MESTSILPVVAIVVLGLLVMQTSVITVVHKVQPDIGLCLRLVLLGSVIGALIAFAR